jgi:DMSO/TMAO reductase YedYZ molybdopterin-dependent catalytic subunit
MDKTTKPFVPAQGYPLRLLLPGWEGNTNLKWLQSLKLTDQPYMARDETSKSFDHALTGRHAQPRLMILDVPGGRVQHLPDAL